MKGQWARRVEHVCTSVESQQFAPEFHVGAASLHFLHMLTQCQLLMSKYYSFRSRASICSFLHCPKHFFTCFTLTLSLASMYIWFCKISAFSSHLSKCKAFIAVSRIFLEFWSKLCLFCIMICEFQRQMLFQWALDNCPLWHQNLTLNVHLLLIDLLLEK